MKVKRKSRNVMAKKFDTLIPIDISLIGTKDDPCFGKFNDPKAPECARCGDAEICAIVCQQNNHLRRAQVESAQEFKDIQEKDMKFADPVKVKKLVKNRIRELAKRHGKEGVAIDFVLTDIVGTYSIHGYTNKRVTKIINKILEGSNKLKKIDNKLKYQK